MISETDKSNPTATLTTWVSLYADNLYSWALFKTSSKETAEDLVQETFMAAFQNFGKFKGESNSKTWLFAILNNKISDYHRNHYCNPTIAERKQSESWKDVSNDVFFDSIGQWREDQRPFDWPLGAEEYLDNDEFNRVLLHCMGKLPANWCSALQLKYLEEKKGEIICQELDLSPTNFWQILHRAKLQLRKCLEINWFKS
ncbi:MAG TPA: sigma-70 family RNA polymerase sigma factor [Chitinophagaceae bacterium]|nr:sigma-70 family RNA polymerase sigma factor [Chitinophagaceae bacterium]